MPWRFRLILFQPFSLNCLLWPTFLKLSEVNALPFVALHLQHSLMKSLMRKIVAGPKKKTPYNGQELDLTYITPRIIAMAYPASNFFEKTYRNSIEDVAAYFNEYHKDNYLIINVSSRPYDYSPFHDRVREYDWPDHQAPPLTTLVEIANAARIFLSQRREGVVAVHCNHGKGRTGTAIIAIMLVLGLHQHAVSALAFYNEARFQSDTYGVDQPCQTRYLGYVERVKAVHVLPRRLAAYRLTTVSQKGTHDKHFLTIRKTRTGEMLMQRCGFGQHYGEGIPLLADLYIELFQQVWSGPKKLARINFHPFFLNPSVELNHSSLDVTFRSDQIKLSKGVDASFTIRLEFEYYCLCHVEGSEGIECECTVQRNREQPFWKKMLQQLGEAKAIPTEQVNSYFYHPSEGLEQCIKEKQDYEEIFKLTKNLGHLELEKEEPPLVGKKQRKRSSSSED